MLSAKLFTEAALEPKFHKKYELWYFAAYFGYTPEQYRALSYADRQALIAVNDGVKAAEAHPSPNTPVKQPITLRTVRRGRRR